MLKFGICLIITACFVMPTLAVRQLNSSFCDYACGVTINNHNIIGTGNSSSSAEGVAVDSSNNIVVASDYYTGERYAIRVQKYDNVTGKIIWQTDFSEYSDNYCKAVVIDSSDNIYVGGFVFGGWGEYLPISDYVIIKYDKDGNKIASKTYNYFVADFMGDMGIDSSDNLYATGMILDINNFSELISIKFWTIKVNSDKLNKMSEKTFGKGNDAAFGIAVRGETVAVAGSVSTIDLNDNIAQNQYGLINYSTNLDFNWGRYYPESPPPVYNASGGDAAILSNGDIVITGNDEEDVYTIVYDKRGTMKWNKKEISNRHDDAITIASDSKDNIISAGYRTVDGWPIYRQWYMVKYDKQGNTQWEKIEEFEGEIKRIAVDSNDNIIAVGYQRIAENDKICIRKYNEMGILLWEANEGSLEIGTISGGMQITAQVKNNMIKEASNIPWSFDLSGMILFGRHTSGTISSLPAGDMMLIESGIILGLGPATLTVAAGEASKTVRCILIGPLVLVS
jgi:hypothetical protein